MPETPATYRDEWSRPVPEGYRIKESRMKFSRVWAMPSHETYGIAPIAALLDRYLVGRACIIDPFARNSTRGTVTNDLNPATTAQHHLDAREFCEILVRDGVRADAVLFDPPYSPRQISEVYQHIGRTCSTADTQSAALYAKVKDCLAAVLRHGGLAICFGWNSCGLGIARGFELLEVMTVCHGGAHNDTIVTVERRLPTLLTGRKAFKNRIRKMLRFNHPDRFDFVAMSPQDF